jgi:hypothetical protein
MNGTKLSDIVFCSTCIFWQAVQRDDKGVPVGGLCRRNPPMAFMVQGPPDALGRPTMQAGAQFPPTASGEWCGEHDSGVEEDGSDEEDREPN